MANEQDSWLEDMGVDFSSVVNDTAEATESTASAAAETMATGPDNVPDAPDVSAAEQPTNPGTGETSDSSHKEQNACAGSDGSDGSGSSVFGAIGDFASGVADGVETAASTAADGATELAGDVAEGVTDAAEAVADKASEWYEEAKEAVEGSDLPYQFGGVQAPFEKAVDEAAEEGRLIAARPLTSGEMADAKLIFGDSLDYSKVLVDGGALESIGSARTVGNTVHLTSDLFQPGSSETTTEGKRTLVHELTHVWQYQHQGWTYAPKALWAQAQAAVRGTRNGAYDYATLIAKGIPWEEWNPEAQAQAVEDYNEALHNVNDHVAEAKDYETVQSLAKYVRNVGTPPAPEDGPCDPVFNCAVDMNARVDIEEDGSWSCSWSWTYVGTTFIEGCVLQDELMLMDEKGGMLDAVKGEWHELKPGQTYLGSAAGKQKIRADKVTWRLTIPFKGGYVGATSGSVAATTVAT